MNRLIEGVPTLPREAQATQQDVELILDLVNANNKLAGVDNIVAERAKQVNALEQTAPHGRCDLCNLALDLWDGAYKAGMHNMCAGGLYE
ncbi:hypothetical protein [Mycobacteroides abscessus]|uniref:hypothetical protein n=1 Tax=Mycobacteroides abscessus TaxID=36809 RepID=UPI00092947D5|nr:hypothetical protein [Mycobacteroides abscessus]SIC59773.1 Uncharacterised protein [Mycobacteroides abscessus subsp. abscessus]